MSNPITLLRLFCDPNVSDDFRDALYNAFNIDQNGNIRKNFNQNSEYVFNKNLCALGFDGFIYNVYNRGEEIYLCNPKIVKIFKRIAKFIPI